ncbi:hypothetical protein ACFX2I_044857 [Malus domestica]
MPRPKPTSRFVLFTLTLLLHFPTPSNPLNLKTSPQAKPKTEEQHHQQRFGLRCQDEQRQRMEEREREHTASLVGSGLWVDVGSNWSFMEAEMVESGDKPHDFLRCVSEVEVGKWSRSRRARVTMTHLKMGFGGFYRRKWVLVN